MRNVKLLLVSFLLTAGMMTIFTKTLTAQTVSKSVSGTVLDPDSQPISNVTVTVKGSTKTTKTIEDGTFHIPAKKGDVLVFSSVAYTTQNVIITNQIDYTIHLQSQTLSLDEVVVTALGIKKKTEAVGYAVQKVDNRSLTRAQDPNLINNLAGKVAGLQVTNGGAGVGSTSRVVIRGENSFSGSNQPLFVVDGVPINNETFFNDAIENSSSQGNWSEVDWGNGAAEINPNDIESMTVLKGPAAAALYGSRSSNGAIVITTKKGKSLAKGLIGVDFNSSTSIQTPLVLPRIQNQYGAGNGLVPYKYVNGAGTAENNIPNFGQKFDSNLLVPQFNSPTSDGFLAAELANRGTNSTITPTPWVGHSDNFKNFLQTGVTTQNSISLSGASKIGNFRMSYSNLYNKGILPNTDLKRNSISFGGNQNLNSHLSVNYFINYIRSGSDNRPNIGYGSESVMYTFFGVYGMPINIDINALKNKQWQTGQDQVNQFRYWNNHDNPYVTLNNNTNSFTKNRWLGNASVKYDFDGHFSLMLRSGMDTYQDDRAQQRVFSTVRFPTGGYRTDNVGYFENNTDYLFNYNSGSKGDFHASLSLGGNRFYQETNYVRDIANSLNTPGVFNFSNAQSQLPTLNQTFRKLMYSNYAFGDFDYKKQLFLNATFRNDISSTLPSKNNSYYYPSVSLSAVVSNMVKLPSFISYLKVRASGAAVGKDVDPYSLNATYLNNTPINGNSLSVTNSVLANPNLKPSTTSSFEAGMNIQFFKGRLGIDATVYNAVTKNEIVQLPIPVSSGYTNVVVNGGKLGNKGVEVILNATPIAPKHSGGFNWDLSLNFSRNVGHILGLPSGVDVYKYAQITQYDRYYRAIQYNAVVGERIGNMYGNGFVRDDKGAIVYKDGLPQVTTDQNKLLGNYNPNFMLGWTNQFAYKDFTLSTVVDWHQGGKFYSYTELGLLNGGMSVETLPNRDGTIVGKGVMKDATGNYVPNTVVVPAATYYLNYYSANNNEVFTYDASYLKLREVRIGYTFHHFFGKGTKAKLNCALIGRNLLLITQNKDVDPETLALRGNKILPGTEFLSIPSQRSYGVSFGLSF